MNRLVARSVLMFLALILFAATVFSQPAPDPVLVESSPTSGSVYTTEPQFISYHALLDLTALNAEAQRRGTGFGYGGYATFISVDDPNRVIGPNDAEFVNRSPMAGYNQWIIDGDIISKRLLPGNYIIRFNFDSSFVGQPPTHWQHDIPITLTGVPPAPLPPATYHWTLEAPLPPIQFPAGHENIFAYTARLLPNVPGKIITMFGHDARLRDPLNPGQPMDPMLARVQSDPMGGFNSGNGTVFIHLDLPAGHYELVLSALWEESGPEHTGLDSTQYNGEIVVPFDLTGAAPPDGTPPGAGSWSVIRTLPRQPVLAGIPFIVQLAVDPQQQSFTGLVATETLASELSFLPLPGTLTPPETNQNPYVWLLRNPTRIPFSTIDYLVTVKDTVLPGTVIRFNGQAEVLHQMNPVAGDQNVTVATTVLHCPIPNQVLLTTIDHWGRWVRDDVAPADPIVDDLSLLQIIERWRNCLRGGNA